MVGRLAVDIESLDFVLGGGERDMVEELVFWVEGPKELLRSLRVVEKGLGTRPDSLDEGTRLLLGLVRLLVRLECLRFFSFSLSDTALGTPSHLELTFGTLGGILASDTMARPAGEGPSPVAGCCFFRACSYSNNARFDGSLTDRKLKSDDFFLESDTGEKGCFFGRLEFSVDEERWDLLERGETLEEGGGLFKADVIKQMESWLGEPLAWP